MDEHLKKIQADVDLMNRTFDKDVAESDEPDDPKTDAPTTDIPDDPKTDAPTTDAPDDGIETDPPTTDAPDERDQTIADLRAKLNEKPSKETSTKPPTTDAPITFEAQDFVKDLDIESLGDNPEEFNKLLNNVYQKAISDANKGIGDKFTQSIPGMVTTVTTLQRAAEEFYSENEDLRPFKKVVATVFDDLSAKDANKSYIDLIKDVAPEVRKRLELPENIKKLDRGKPPKLPRKKGKPGKSKDKPAPNPLQDELEEMNEVLRR